jgi:hypothetical protein
MKTISELNAKWWYRLLKVIYLAIFTLSFVAVVIQINDTLSPYQVLDFKNSKVVCLSGNKNQVTFNDLLLKVDKDDLKYERLDAVKIASICEIVGPYGELFSMSDGEPTRMSRADYNSFYSIENRPLALEWSAKVVNMVQYEKSYTTIGSWLDVIGAILLAIAIVAVIFELIRRIFYYIVLGSLRPKKKHESDTILP